MTIGERMTWCVNCGGLFPDGQHHHCMGHAQFTPYPAGERQNGAVVVPLLTEERVRQIVREELARNAGVSAALTPREVELLREIRVNFGNLDRLSADWRNEARNLLLRIEQGNAGVAGTLKENGNG